MRGQGLVEGAAASVRGLTGAARAAAAAGPAAGDPDPDPGADLNSDLDANPSTPSGGEHSLATQKRRATA